MIRTTLDNAHIQRTFRILYGWTQATAQDKKLDPRWDRSTPIYPGMVAMKTRGDMFTLINDEGTPLGFIAEFIGGDGIDALKARGVNACAVWVLDPGGEAEILAPAFDTTATWEEPDDGTVALVYASTDGDNRGKLVPEGAANASAQPVARLIRVDGANKIVVGGLHAGDAAPATASTGG